MLYRFRSNYISIFIHISTSSSITFIINNNIIISHLYNPHTGTSTDTASIINITSISSIYIDSPTIGFFYFGVINHIISP